MHIKTIMEFKVTYFCAVCVKPIKTLHELEGPTDTHKCCSQECCDKKQKEYALTSLEREIQKCKSQIMNDGQVMTLIQQNKNTQVSKKTAKRIEQQILFNKIFKLELIILMSIRDKKGTYPAFKEKFALLHDELVSKTTTRDLAEVVSGYMKLEAERHEAYYETL